MELLRALLTMWLYLGRGVYKVFLQEEPPQQIDNILYYEGVNLGLKKNKPEATQRGRSIPKGVMFQQSWLCLFNGKQINKLISLSRRQKSHRKGQLIILSHPDNLCLDKNRIPLTFSFVDCFPQHPGQRDEIHQLVPAYHCYIARGACHWPGVLDIKFKASLEKKVKHQADSLRQRVCNTIGRVCAGPHFPTGTSFTAICTSLNRLMREAEAPTLWDKVVVAKTAIAFININRAELGVGLLKRSSTTTAATNSLVKLLAATVAEVDAEIRLVRARGQDLDSPLRLLLSNAAFLIGPYEDTEPFVGDTEGADLFDAGDNDISQ